jgi:hypothetical protein
METTAIENCRILPLKLRRLLIKCGNYNLVYFFRWEKKLCLEITICLFVMVCRRVSQRQCTCILTYEPADQFSQTLLWKLLFEASRRPKFQFPTLEETSTLKMETVISPKPWRTGTMRCRDPDLIMSWQLTFLYMKRPQIFSPYSSTLESIHMALNKTGTVHINVKLRRVRVTIVAVEEQ